MKKLGRYVFVCLIPALSACQATLIELSPVKGSDQSLSYISGQEFIHSERKNSKVIVSTSQAIIQQGGDAGFEVIVYNKSSSPINLLIKDIHARSSSGIAIIPTDFTEQIAEIRGERRSKPSFLSNTMKFLGAFAAAGSNQTNKSTTVHKGKIGGTNYEGTSTTVTEDPYLEKMKREEEQAKRKTQIEAINSFEKSLLKNHTLQPDEIYTGRLFLKIPKEEIPAASFTLTIPVAGDTHEFIFNKESKSS